MLILKSYVIYKLNNMVYHQAPIPTKWHSLKLLVQIEKLQPKS